MKKYTETHEWIERTHEEDVVCVGISAFAQREVGEIVYVELPEVGKEVLVGEAVAVLESTKAAADIYSPLSGTITDVNCHLKKCTELLNTSPESDGWIFKIKYKKPQELDHLIEAPIYKKNCF